MPWTYGQRLDKACKALIDRNKLEETEIVVIRRPLFFGKYAYGVGLSLALNSWGDWFEIKDRVQVGLEDLDCMIQSNRKTYQFNLFSSDPTMLRRIMKMPYFTFNHVRIVDESCWHLKLPKPKPKGKFYGEFGWRFAFKDPLWASVPENLELLEGLSGSYKLMTLPKTFLYLSLLSDVLLFKLVASEQLLSLEDRHSL